MELKPKTILLSLAGVLATLFILYLVYKATSPINTKEALEILKPKKTDHIKWNKNAKNTLVEYSDLQCPACKNFHDLLKTLESTNSAYPEITKTTKFIYRHFPLQTIHKNAFSAALAAESAGKQGKFFEMVDLLFETQEKWSNLDNPQSYFEELAKKLNLNLAKFKKDYNSDDVKQKVLSDMQSGEKLKIFGTPTFFLNGKRLEFNTYQEFIEKLKKQRAN